MCATRGSWFADLMNRTARLIAVAALLTGSIGVLTACSSHTEVTYRAWTDGGNIAEVAPYELDGPNGGIVLPETVDDTEWESTVNGGTSPEITVTPDGADTVAHCEIVYAKTGVTLDEQKGTPGEPVVCSTTVSEKTF